MIGQEIERKFLVKQLPDLSQAKQTRILQGYITQPGDSIELRVRQKDEHYFMTLKSGDGLIRTENELAISEQQFLQLWPNTAGQRVEKIRWKGQLAGDLSFELDLFTGELAPLQLVEVEFPDELQASNFSIPEWFGKEVTLNKGYKNKALAIHGIPE